MEGAASGLLDRRHHWRWHFEEDYLQLVRELAEKELDPDGSCKGRKLKATAWIDNYLRIKAPAQFSIVTKIYGLYTMFRNLAVSFCIGISVELGFHVVSHPKYLLTLLLLVYLSFRLYVIYISHQPHRRLGLFIVVAKLANQETGLAGGSQ